MDKHMIGIDLGTSSVKVLCIDKKGNTVSVGQAYEVEAANGDMHHPVVWWKAVCKAFGTLSQRTDLHKTSAIGLTSQVGSYLLYTQGSPEKDMTAISWRMAGGETQLGNLKNRFSKDYFIKHISMPHPDLISYPAPKIRWLQEENHQEWEAADKLLQPKDYLYHKLTGIFASDAYSWRGLANLADGCFHKDFLEDLGIPQGKLPPLYHPSESPGSLLPEIAEELGLDGSIPVFTGCNDFFAALLGMGVIERAQCFDITGTSEHIGRITDSLDDTTGLISGPCFTGYIHYGVTANSGSSMAWAHKTFGRATGLNAGLEEKLLKNAGSPPPVFLPYMQGERAPIWDMKARGVFFGLECSHRLQDLTYSVLEGVVFSVYHIWSGLSVTSAAEIRVAGGAAFDDDLNHIKADLFQLPFVVMKEKDSAALGAAMFAGLGCKWFGTLKEAIERWVTVDHVIRPEKKCKDILRSRFEIFKGLYPVLKDSFALWNDIGRE